eukprot:jgi/Ulvmu1/7099/UM034_0003.1
MIGVCSGGLPGPRLRQHGLCEPGGAMRPLLAGQRQPCRIQQRQHRIGTLRAEGEAAANGGAAGKASEEVPPVVPEPLVAVDGDIVLLHYDCRDDAGEMIDSTRERGEPLTLELGVGEIVGNPLVQALETAVRSHGVGDVVELQLQGGDYKPELIFKVPTDHPEIERLQGRYRSQGGLEVDKVVELQNGQWAKVVAITEAEVTIDANNMLAGLQRRITVEILDIDRPPPDEQ